MFAHLHVHNEYSILDGYGSAAQYAKKAKALGQEFLAFTNHANVDGLIRFQRACEKEGIKPILGCEFYIVPDLTIKVKGEIRHHLTVLIKDDQGWANLCRLLTKANLQGFYHRPRVDFNSVLKHSDGLVFLTGCSNSALNSKEGNAFLAELIRNHKDDVYLELMPHQLESQLEVNRICLEMNRDLGVPLVATNDCHYVEENDDVLQEVLLAIQTKAKWTDKDRWKFEAKGLFLRSEDQMRDAFELQGCVQRKDYLRAMRNTIFVAEKCCNFRIKKQDIYLPSVDTKGQTEEDFLWGLCKKALYDMGLGAEYLARLEEEFSLISKKKFIKYFLIVWELVEWCKASGIMIGPGRGSVGGSLIAYLMGITTVDPIRYNLLFSRFIDEDRIDYPDIDIDFEDVKRPLIREHLEQLYGKNNIASVSTFMEMKGRAAIRDVARVFDLPFKDVDNFAKSISEEGSDESIKASLSTPEGKVFKAKYPKETDLAMRLEGQIRGTGQHAAAVIVSADDLTHSTRCNLAVRSDQEVINWGKDDAEYVGLMKLDILGLNTLTVLNETRRLIKQTHEYDIKFSKIELDDPEVFKMLSNGETIGVFQFGTWATTRLCKEVKVETFGLMSDVVALVRPGPLDSGMTADFVKRKHGAKWAPKNDIYERITADTFGIVIYQEQVMEVIHKVAGLPYSTADKIRKIIGKKRDPKEFKPFEDAFVAGCLEQKTFSEKEAREFWVALQSHARYSFNKSHSVEYAMIAYWTAWCKFYFPAEFMCANLSYGSDGKKEDLVKEARRLGLRVILPKLNISDAFRWTVKGKELYAPFIEIKGVGEKTALEFAKYRTPTNKGFFNLTADVVPTGKVGKILSDIGAFGGKPIDGIQSYFSFNIDFEEPTDEYPKLTKVTGATSCNLDDLLCLNVKVVKGTMQQMRYRNNELLYCKSCLLRRECKRPVLPSCGIYNIPIIGEAPGTQEDEIGKGFVGRSGNDVLWKELDRYSLTRRFFHVTNICKCYPGEVKTPHVVHIEACRHWLEEELSKLSARICLAFGNTSVKFFKGDDGGISRLSGSTTWNEKYGLWVCWCVHPSSVLHNPKSNKELFQAGIRNFVDKINLLGGIE